MCFAIVHKHTCNHTTFSTAIVCNNAPLCATVFGGPIQPLHDCDCCREDVHIFCNPSSEQEISASVRGADSKNDPNVVKEYVGYGMLLGTTLRLSTRVERRMET